jgi:integrase
VLSDDEIRAVWSASPAGDTFGDLVKILLLTGQRREKVVAMRWSDISDEGVWSLPTEKREKGNIGAIALPKMALEIVRSRPRFASNSHVFAAARGKGHFSGFSKAKPALDKKLAAAERDLPNWQVHDLRRTARTLMSRAGVNRDIAERVLGHAIGGVDGVYDQHRYDAEKAKALEALAQLVALILTPSDNVTPMRNARYG